MVLRIAIGALLCMFTAQCEAYDHDTLHVFHFGAEGEQWFTALGEQVGFLGMFPQPPVFPAPPHPLFQAFVKACETLQGRLSCASVNLAQDQHRRDKTLKWAQCTGVPCLVVFHKGKRYGLDSSAGGNFAKLTLMASKPSRIVEWIESLPVALAPLLSKDEI